MRAHRIFMAVRTVHADGTVDREAPEAYNCNQYDAVAGLVDQNKPCACYIHASKETGSGPGE
jgi:hypothetical protein